MYNWKSSTLWRVCYIRTSVTEQWHLYSHRVFGKKNVTGLANIQPFCLVGRFSLGLLYSFDLVNLTINTFGGEFSFETNCASSVGK